MTIIVIMWNHTKCIGMSDAVYDALSNQAPGSEQWFCEECMPTEDPIKGISDDEEDPIATQVNDHNNQSPVNDSEWCDNHSDIFNEYNILRRKAGKSPIFAHININSYKYKFMDIAQIFQNNVFAIFMISETKLDDSYPTAQFDHPGYNIYRKDRNKNGGGILVYTRAELPTRRLVNIEPTNIEGIVLEATFGKTKWAIVTIYKPPCTVDNIFTTDMTRMLELLVIDYDNIMIAGDMKFNLLKGTSKQTESPRNIMDSFGLINLVKNPTCFKGDSPGLLDVILTNRPRCFQYTGTILDGVSDFHATFVTTRRK